MTTSLRHEIRLWKADFRMLETGVEDLGISFIANLDGSHRSAVNVARFSPDGELIASGDCDGCLVIWKISETKKPSPAPADKTLPSDLENWQRFKTPERHNSDICSLCWSPDSIRFATASKDESIAAYDAHTGSRLWHISPYRHFPNGIAWDPRGEFIITLSTDSRFDIVSADTGQHLRGLNTLKIPSFSVLDVPVHAGIYKLFHDDQLLTYSRIPEFSPDGELLLAPSTFVFQDSVQKKINSRQIEKIPFLTLQLRFSTVMATEPFACKLLLEKQFSFDCHFFRLGHNFVFQVDFFMPVQQIFMEHTSSYAQIFIRVVLWRLFHPRSLHFAWRFVRFTLNFEIRIPLLGGEDLVDEQKLFSVFFFSLLPTSCFCKS
ncbi:unnamed protein product [Gongylonema pulchrum]|uniref:WD_REPEATS_REGION domain-containing protein n=1 Tax=Gongylonema pulchrum TaxID=637853 RepID=A0A183E5Q9_9BILA|nr:unnamed protein product [Gongylonema pulchrum]